MTASPTWPELGNKTRDGVRTAARDSGNRTRRDPCMSARSRRFHFVFADILGAMICVLFSKQLDAKILDLMDLRKPIRSIRLRVFVRWKR